VSDYELPHRRFGRPRHEIYRLIRKGKIKADIVCGGPPLWLIPAEEVDKLMPGASKKSDGSEPTAASISSIDAITNN
jgi:hypothetical protein